MKRIDSLLRKEVTILGANGLFGKIISLLLKQSSCINILNLFDYESIEAGEDLRLIKTKCKIRCHSGKENIGDALKSADVIVVSDDVSPGISLYNSHAEFLQKAPKIADYAAKIAACNSAAVVVVATSPVNFTLPLVSGVLNQLGKLDVGKVLGMTNVDNIRANSLLAAHLHVRPRSVWLPVVGGSSQESRVPLFSKARPSLVFNLRMFQKLTSEIKTFDLQVFGAKRENETLNRAYATARLLFAVMAGLEGKKGVVETVMSQQELVKGTSFFSLPVLLGEEGIEKRIPLPNVTDYEARLLSHAIMSLASDASKATDYIRTNVNIEELKVTSRINKLNELDVNNEMSKIKEEEKTLLNSLKIKEKCSSSVKYAFSKNAEIEPISQKQVKNQKLELQQASLEGLNSLCESNGHETKEADLIVVNASTSNNPDKQPTTSKEDDLKSSLVQDTIGNDKEKINNHEKSISKEKSGSIYNYFKRVPDEGMKANSLQREKNSKALLGITANKDIARVEPKQPMGIEADFSLLERKGTNILTSANKEELTSLESLNIEGGKSENLKSHIKRDLKRNSSGRIPPPKPDALERRALVHKTESSPGVKLDNDSINVITSCHMDYTSQISTNRSADKLILSANNENEKKNVVLADTNDKGNFVPRNLNKPCHTTVTNEQADSSTPPEGLAENNNDRATEVVILYPSASKNVSNFTSQDNDKAKVNVSTSDSKVTVGKKEKVDLAQTVIGPVSDVSDKKTLELNPDDLHPVVQNLSSISDSKKPSVSPVQDLFDKQQEYTNSIRSNVKSPSSSSKVKRENNENDTNLNCQSISNDSNELCCCIAHVSLRKDSTKLHASGKSIIMNGQLFKEVKDRFSYFPITESLRFTSTEPCSKESPDITSNVNKKKYKPRPEEIWKFFKEKRALPANENFVSQDGPAATVLKRKNSPVSNIKIAQGLKRSNNDMVSLTQKMKEKQKQLITTLKNNNVVFDKEKAELPISNNSTHSLKIRDSQKVKLNISFTNNASIKNDEIKKENSLDKSKSALPDGKTYEQKQGLDVIPGDKKNVEDNVALKNTKLESCSNSTTKNNVGQEKENISDQNCRQKFEINLEEKSFEMKNSEQNPNICKASKESNISLCFNEGNIKKELMVIEPPVIQKETSATSKTALVATSVSPSSCESSKIKC